jgi:sugar (pentulose or hexulose) kinase
LAVDVSLLSIDIGTTHCKAGLFALDGKTLRIATRPMLVQRASTGEMYFEPDHVWKAVSDVIREAASLSGSIAAIGIASMAETGLLLDRRTGAARSSFLPWFDTSSQPQADLIRRQSDPLERYLKTGLRAVFKCSLAKILWLRENHDGLFENAVWLSVCDYIAYRMTGKFGTDRSLAAFTFAYRVDQHIWDSDWLREWKLDPDLFPEALPSGTPIANLRPEAADALGLPAGIPVTISGHDHANAAFAMNVTSPGQVFNSMGTAETLIGALPERLLNADDFRTGLQYGCHVAHGQGYWLGSLSASGGSVEWMRRQVNDQQLSYQEMGELLDSTRLEPTGILYFPYLLGSGAPHADPKVRGALIGLSASDGRADLLKAILEGTAYEVEFIRQAGEHFTGQPAATLVAAGGGTRNRAWLQIKADVTGCSIEASAEPEAALQGAALVAGIGSGVYVSQAEAFAGLALHPMHVFLPDLARHEKYQQLYEQGYLFFQKALRQYFNENDK